MSVLFIVASISLAVTFVVAWTSDSLVLFGISYTTFLVSWVILMLKKGTI